MTIQYKLPLPSLISLFDSSLEVVELAGKLDELAVEFGVPFGGNGSAEPFVFNELVGVSDAAVGPPAFNEPADNANRPAAAEFDGEIPAAESAAAADAGKPAACNIAGCGPKPGIPAAAAAAAAAAALVGIAPGPCAGVAGIPC